MKLKEIKKYCEICNKSLVLKNKRDIIRKRFCSKNCKHKDSKSYLTERGRKSLSIKNSKPNSKKSLPGNKNPNWKGGKIIHKCLICNQNFEVSIYKHNKGYGKWCSKQCYNHHLENSREVIKCLECNKNIISPIKKNRKFCSVSCRASFYIKKETFGKSKAETDFLNFLQINNRNVSIKNFVVDGLKENVIYEFLGDYWHGNPDIFSNKNDIHTPTGKTYETLLNQTFERFHKLKEMGYEIKYIWESDWTKYKENKSIYPKIQTYL